MLNFFRRTLSLQIQDTRVSVALLIMRVVIGLAMMFHGFGKIQSPFGWMGPDAPIPGFLQALAALSEFGGGLAWLVGLLTPLASIGILITMGVAASTHIMRGDPFVGYEGSYELASVYFTFAILLLLAGPGRFAIDSLIARRGQK